jgi:hypothetical protein
MDLIILLIRLLASGSESKRSRAASQNLPTFTPAATQPPPANRPPPAGAAGARPLAPRSASKAKRKPASAAKLAPSAVRAAVQPAPAIPSATPASRAAAAPATLIAEALRSPRNFAAALSMTELLRPPASLRTYRTGLD